MSLKVNNGYVLPKMSAADLFTFVKEKQKEFLKLRKELYHKELFKICIDTFDGLASGRITLKEYIQIKEWKGNTILRDSIYKIISIRKDLEEFRLIDSKFHFESFGVFFPIKNKTLVLFYGNEAFIKKWKSFEIIKEYHYQNQYDKPSNISSREWNKRGKEWKPLLTYNGNPIEDGFKFIFTNEVGIYEYFSNEELKPLITQITFEERVKNESDLIFTDYIKKSYSNSDEGQGKFKEIKEHVINTIKKDLTIDDFLEKLF